jgi:hypothetical protein
MKDSILFYVMVGFAILICIKIYTGMDEFQLKCIISSVDGNRYCVRDRAKIKSAADLLATITSRCKQLVMHMKDKYPTNSKVELLVSGFNPKRITETLPTSEMTAYSENKGEKIAFCLNKNKENNSKLIDVNTLMFVAIHELSHIMTLSIGHKPEFWENFKLLIENAKEIGIYDPVDYKKKPENYCGMTITDNPYYDLT